MGCNNLYDWAMSQKLPLNNFEWIEDASQFNEEYNEEYFLEFHVPCLEILHELHNDLPSSPERMSIEKFKKLVTNLHVKPEYLIRVKILKQALNHGLILKNF